MTKARKDIEITVHGWYCRKCRINIDSKRFYVGDVLHYGECSCLLEEPLSQFSAEKMHSHWVRTYREIDRENQYILKNTYDFIGKVN